MQDENQAPWKGRYRAAQVIGVQIAPANPGRGLVVSNASGKYQLYAWELPVNTLRQLTDHSQGCLEGVISGDGHYVYYLEDRHGNEIGHFVRVPFEGGATEDLTPGLQPYSSFSFFSSGSGSHFGFMAASADGFSIYSLQTNSHAAPAAPRRLFHSSQLIHGPVFSFEGEAAVVATTGRSSMQHYDLRLFDPDSGEQIAELWDGLGTSLWPLLFSPIPGDLRLAGTTNRSGARRPFLWNIRTGKRVDLELADFPGEVIPFDWSPDGSRLLICQFSQAVQQLFLYELASGALTRLEHPNGTYDSPGTYFGPNDEILGLWQDAAHPSQVIALDGRTGVKRRAVLAVGDVPSGHAWRSVAFPSSDGQSIQGWLGLPEGKGPFPAILHTHGGPESVMTELFEPGSQAWLDHGFAYLTINYRGSTSFGREFQEKIWGDVGHWEMEDLAAGRDWLVNEGIARAEAVLLTGRSYGGFNTLMGLGRRPGLWAGGMALVAVADWAMMYEDAADSLKGYLGVLFGGSPQQVPERYRRGSPITYAENITAPVLIIQGRNDTRTPARQIEAFEQKLKQLGKPIEVHWFNAGHFGAGIERDIENFEIMLHFAQKVLASQLT